MHTPGELSVADPGNLHHPADSSVLAEGSSKSSSLLDFPAEETHRKLPD